MTARERFARTRRYVLEHHQIQLAIMYEGDDWKPDNVKVPGVADPTANAAIRNVDEWGAKLESLNKRKDELEHYIGTSLAIINAVRNGLGHDYARLLEQRYIDCLEWRDVELDGKPVKKSTGKLKVGVAFDWIDAIGVSRLLKGEYEV